MCACTRALFIFLYFDVIASATIHNIYYMDDTLCLVHKLFLLKPNTAFCSVFFFSYVVWPCMYYVRSFLPVLLTFSSSFSFALVLAPSIFWCSIQFRMKFTAYHMFAHAKCLHKHAQRRFLFWILHSEMYLIMRLFVFFSLSVSFTPLSLSLSFSTISSIYLCQSVVYRKEKSFLLTKWASPLCFTYT